MSNPEDRPEMTPEEAARINAEVKRERAIERGDHSLSGAGIAQRLSFGQDSSSGLISHTPDEWEDARRQVDWQNAHPKRPLGEKGNGSEPSR